MAYTGPFPYTNTGTAVAIDVTNTSFTGNVSNTGVINPGGIVVTSSTIDGGIYDSGFIGGGIRVDSHSVIIYRQTNIGHRIDLRGRPHQCRQDFSGRYRYLCRRRLGFCGRHCQQRRDLHDRQ